MKMRQRMLVLIVLSICSLHVVYSSMDISSSSNTTFDDLCRFNGRCLNCSKGGCDDMCEFYHNDCCHGTSYKTSTLEKWQFSCLRMYPEMYELNLDCRGSYDGVYGVYMVAKCSNLWTDELIKSKCKNNTDDDLLSRIPVYDNILDIVTYKNMYCAFCNMLPFERLSFWRFDMLCNYGVEKNLSIHDTDFNAELCFIRFVDRPHKMCALNVVDSCGSDQNRNLTYLPNKCENGLSQNVYVWRYERVFTVYKNEYCAQCNGEINQLQCWAFQAFTCWPLSLPHYTTVTPGINLNMYGDINKDTNGESNRDTQQILNSDCGDGVLFSPFSKKCLNITCLQLLNTCVSGECYLVRLLNSEFEIKNFSNLYLYALKDSFPLDKYFLRHQNVYICLYEYQYLEFQISRQTTTPKVTIKSMQSTEKISIVVSKGHINCKMYIEIVLLVSSVFLL